MIETKLDWKDLVLIPDKYLKLIVNSSRSIIYASNNSDFAQMAQNEAKKIQKEMEKYLKNI